MTRIMTNDDLKRTWLLTCGSRYFDGLGVARVSALPMPCIGLSGLGHAFLQVELPAWARDLGVGGRLMVDAASVMAGEGEPWRRCDWLAAAFSHLTGAFERRQEEAEGPIRSYAFRLKNAPPGLFDRAWANRIFLFLRRWAAQEAGMAEAGLFGKLPAADIVLTHDVDAIRKTPEIRLKQGAFHAWNAARSAIGGKPDDAFRGAADGIRFAVRGGPIETLAEVRALERERGLRSVLHFYAGPPGLQRVHPVRMLLDPAYDIANPYLVREMRVFAEEGWTIGLHPSVGTWADPARLASERSRLARAAGIEPLLCRQHWLRFSWAKTWAAQEQAGLRLDSTLGFNDRPGLRNGAALRVRPWQADQARALDIETMPMLFMDSHFYDYSRPDPEARRAEMARWLDEVRAVGGEASVNWHTHTIGPDYGWGDGYRELVDLLAGQAR